MEFVIVLLGLTSYFFAFVNSDVTDVILYNREKEVCCEGTVFGLQNLPLKCCGSQTYNEDKEICCNGVIFENNEQNLTCCNNRLINIQNNEYCCDDNLVQLPGLVGDFECCGKLAYPLDSTMLCCGETIHKHEDNPNAAFTCCGQLMYNENLQACCGGKVIDKPPSVCPSSIDYNCCGNLIVGPSQLCCNGAVVNLNQNKDYENVDNKNAYCCGSLVIQNPEVERCCKGNIFFGDKRHSCCGANLYHMDTQFCCLDKIYSGTAECCGSVPFDSGKQVCCKGVVFELVDGKDTCWYPGIVDRNDNEEGNDDVL